MTTLSLVLAILALVVAFAAWSRAGGAARAVEDARTDARRYASSVGEEQSAALGVLRRQLGMLAAGERMTREMIAEGLVFHDLETGAARELLEAGDVFVLDVRTASEVRAGVLPGATHIPMDELESRLAEIPSTQKKLVYCAGGVRSVAVCEALAQRGFEGLHNLAGGMGSWNGPVVPPTP